MLRDRFIKRLLIFAFCVALGAQLTLYGLAQIDMNDPAHSFISIAKDAPAPKFRMPVLTRAGMKHIIFGDEAGGGHKYGTGRPCKSEFPKEWDNNKIYQVVAKTAANENLSWKEQKNGYHVAEEDHEGVMVRVVVDRKRNMIVTGYPTNLTRNPCPAAANDNEKE